ncbi:MAG: VWA domain-containing protein, partial [Planctomycetota bacterium]
MVERSWILLLVIPAAVLVFVAATRFSLRGWRWSQRTAGIFLRTALVALVLGALAAPRLFLKGGVPEAVLVVDVSESMRAGGVESLMADLRDDIGRFPADTRMSVVVFGGEARVLLSPRPRADVRPETVAAAVKGLLSGLTAPGAPPGGASDAEKALRLARTLFSGGGQRIIYFYTDGRLNRGDAAAEAEALRKDGGVLIADVVTHPSAGDPRLGRIRAPVEIPEGEPFDADVEVSAPREQAGRVRFFRDGYRVEERDVVLSAGAGTVRFPNLRLNAGYHELRAELDAPGDAENRNNTTLAAVTVTGPPRVLIIGGGAEDTRHLEAALAAEGIATETRPAEAAPREVPEILNFSAVLLVNVPAKRLGEPAMALLRRYAEDYGGGVAMIGGDESFGLGDYARTPVADLLPVRIPMKKKVEISNLALVLVVDRSGSMQGEKIGLAKEAAIRTAEILKKSDLIGVAAFDTVPRWVLEPTPAGETDRIARQVARLTEGGGTDIHPALKMAFQGLRKVEAQLKHVILLSDGQTQFGDFQGLVSSMTAEGITVSTVAIGEDSDKVLLANIARWGNGRFYYTANFQEIPQIFTKETIKASRAMLVEKPVKAVVGAPASFLAGLSLPGLPFLYGYVATSPRDGAMVHLATENGDPLLASWRYGLGRTLAWTSDASARWAADWVKSPLFSKFWAQCVRGLLPGGIRGGDVLATTRVMIRRGIAGVEVEARDRLGRPLEDIENLWWVETPAGERRPLAVREAGVGRYRAAFPVEEYGRFYRVGVAQERGGASANRMVYGVIEPFPPEFAASDDAGAEILAAARSTGGGPRGTIPPRQTARRDERAV